MGKNHFFNETEVNEENIENQSNNSMSQYSDQIYVGQSNAKEVMFDRRNPIVKAILIVLGLIALIGTIYYIFIFFTTMK